MLRLLFTRTPMRSCSQWGLPCHLRYRKCGALLPHPFTLAVRRESSCVLHKASFVSRQFAFCGTFPKVTLAGRYPALCRHGARTFLSLIF